MQPKFTIPSLLGGPDMAGCLGLATPTEAARFLQLSRSIVFKLIAQRKIPTWRYGRAVRVPWMWLISPSQTVLRSEVR